MATALFEVEELGGGAEAQRVSPWTRRQRGLEHHPPYESEAGRPPKVPRGEERSRKLVWGSPGAAPCGVGRECQSPAFQALPGIPMNRRVRSVCVRATHAGPQAQGLLGEQRVEVEGGHGLLERVAAPVALEPRQRVYPLVDRERRSPAEVRAPPPASVPACREGLGRRRNLPVDHRRVRLAGLHAPGLPTRAHALPLQRHVRLDVHEVCLLLLRRRRRGRSEGARGGQPPSGLLFTGKPQVSAESTLDCQAGPATDIGRRWERSPGSPRGGTARRGCGGWGDDEGRMWEEVVAGRMLREVLPFPPPPTAPTGQHARGGRDGDGGLRVPRGAGPCAGGWRGEVRRLGVHGRPRGVTHTQPGGPRRGGSGHLPARPRWP